MAFFRTCSDQLSRTGRKMGLAPPAPRSLIVAVVAACIVWASTATAKIIYVDDDATGLDNGTSWPNAYTFLQDALADADSADKPVEIRVAQGTYKPDQGANQTPGDREATFGLISGVTIRGGYAGLGAPDPNARDIAQYETILSGDLGEPNRTHDNSYHVVTGSGTDSSAVIHGLTVSDGHAYKLPDHFEGGGMYNNNGSPTVIECLFRDNSASVMLSPRGGGGMYNGSGSNPRVVKCTFSHNYSGRGAGMLNYDSSPTIVGCLFIDNSGGIAGGFGAGMANQNASPMIQDCTFADNWAAGDAAMQNIESSPEIVNCLFENNMAAAAAGIRNIQSKTVIRNSVFRRNLDEAISNTTHSELLLLGCTLTGNYGDNGAALRNCENSSAVLENCVLDGHAGYHPAGAIACVHRSRLRVRNCTFVGNWGGAVSCYSDWSDEPMPSDVEIINSILWEKQQPTPIWNSDGSRVVVTYTNVGADWPGEGNLDGDPCFANPGYWDPNGTLDYRHDDFWVEGDYHLKSQAGRWGPVSHTWVIDDVTSPCIDAGDPMSPIGHELFPNGGRINMGAYGGTAEASKSYFGEPVCETIVAGDISGDCRVDWQDLAIMALRWLEGRNP